MRGLVLAQHYAFMTHIKATLETMKWQSKLCTNDV